MGTSPLNRGYHTVVRYSPNRWVVSTNFVPMYELTPQKGSEMAKQPHRGRPTTSRQQGMRSTLSLRVTAELFKHLDDAAKAKGRPLSQEAEMLLEHGVRDEE